MPYRIVNRDLVPVVKLAYRYLAPVEGAGAHECQWYDDYTLVIGEGAYRFQACAVCEEVRALSGEDPSDG